jgi:hypothetical protein
LSPHSNLFIATPIAAALNYAMTAAPDDLLAMAAIIAEARRIADEQVAWWQEQPNLCPGDVLFVLTRKRRQYVGWREVWGYVYRWECRRIFRQQPRPMRRAA